MPLAPTLASFPGSSPANTAKISAAHHSDHNENALGNVARA
eukprot:CAMPEP_0115051672 /NCGR_PEP_ID=MMETSP0227-20121206/2478_1 /TAXON_ID=89957 /ORGANISM="Polarella glacialis, Strain CCMP 1383" /LENGTH=40 /DNA_ID= /DNA_START= /DNA_END= /DNA_ORIENTATION=